MYNSARFLKYAKEFLGADINQETINQVKEISELQKSNLPRIMSIQRRAEQIEQFIYKWLQNRYFDDEVIRNDRFPDFTVVKENQKIAYEIKYIRDARHIFSRWREIGYRGFYEVSQGNFDTFCIAFVVDHDANSGVQRVIKGLEIPTGVKIQVFEAFIDSNENVVDLHFVAESSSNKDG